MAFAIDDDDRASGASSDNDQDELMEDIGSPAIDDMEADVDGDGDALGEQEDEDEDDDNDDDDQEETQDQRQESPKLLQSQPEQASLPNTDESSDDLPNGQLYTNGATDPTSHVRSSEIPATGSPRRTSIPPLPNLRPSIRPEALTASLYDIVPTMAAPQATSINAITATPDMRYWFSGGSDCYVRKYDGAATVNGKTLLTVAQRHPFVDTVTKAGVLMSYWENEEPISKPGDEPALSPVYSLAVQSEALWLLSGLESGCINLQSVRHDEGKRIAFLQKHTSAVSVLSLSSDEKSVLSGSWDKNILDWDLNTGQARRAFTGSGGQISAIEIRPASSLPVPEESGEPVAFSSTFSSNNADKPTTNGFIPNGVVTNGATIAIDGQGDAAGSPVETNSLFGDTDSLFGDGDAGGAPSGGNFAADDDDEFSKAIGGIDQQDQHDQLVSQAGTAMEDAARPGGDQSSVPPPPAEAEPESFAIEPLKEEQPASPRQLTNGLPHAEELVEAAETSEAVPSTQDAVATSDSTFLAAAIDGTLRVWDRRMPNPVAKIPNRQGVPPWCMAACWSPDGNYIYAGRRNGTVEEFSLHKGLKGPERTFKFPAGSGAVSAVRAMPNGRHLICASHDILRLYDLKQTEAVKHSTVPFLIVPGPPRAGVISALHIDPTCRYMLSTAGNRGWDGSSTEVLIGYEIGIVR
ncbi:transcription factor, putative member of histone acetyltransferase SAGA complex [Pseudogymnoascus destructans]|uniref:Transcription factor spt8 beta-propeller domain-containing protein n=2 Tax=Pseudogymnoascus destructans TaxID=655981 RepID=L8G2P4_PSED2|nr:transcription factor, putative member of histone acetyltransferase SAGA complex [Pseudogymnoascus destructans]ELR07069.1 hypothetical protein GMDG_08246 [Pseudogymnoascus destructans 20631-21]OAF59889.1 transcription factor, putative member of histone acetyltransferase SAGA complex [Pseudogymnoascus destructans]